MSSDLYVITPTHPVVLENAPTIKRRRSMNFKLYPIIYYFSKENKEFVVPRGGLPADSKRFDDIYRRHLQHTPWNRYGTPSIGYPGNWDNDFLDGVRADEFQSLLKLTCLFVSEAQEDLTFNDWMAVLKLSHRWDMRDTHARAVKGLDGEIRKYSAGGKMVLGKRFRVEKWFKEGFAAFVAGKEQIAAKEYHELGWETYARLLEAKDKAGAQACEDDQMFKVAYTSS